ncbi:MAG: M16 family metallopeptidase [Vulcanimicrobiaceae bacterium]
MNLRTAGRVALATFAAIVLAALPWRTQAAGLAVTRATLSNGLRVIVVRNPLAPVVTTVLNYEAGSDDQFVAGLAHATEHMMFRGSKTISSSQLMDTIDITGGDFDADTQNEITQYFFTVPSEYLDIALRLERSRASGLLMSQNLWQKERGAITQEVTQDNSNAVYRLFVKMQSRLIGGTPYDNNTLGTVHDFATNVNSPQLLKFYHTWYHPNNAIYVIVGDVDGPSTIAKVRAIFGDLPAGKLPPRAPVHLQPVKPAIYHDNSDLPVTVVLLGYRMPGYDSADYAAASILNDVLSSQRADLYGLVAAGKSIQAGFQVQSYPKTSIGIGYNVVPVTTKPEDADAAFRAVIDGYRKTGVPADLVEAAKRREIAELEYSASSIEGLAFQWSTAVAVQGLNAPADMLAKYNGVTVDDVNRVLRTYLDNGKAVAAYAVPKNLGAVSSGGGPGGLGKEDNAIPPEAHQPLPDWARDVLANLRAPDQTLHPVESTLSNGIHLIVQPDSSTNSVYVSGRILNDPDVQSPPGKDGVADVTDALLPYGTTTYGRLAYQAELDKIAADVNTGTDFSAQVLAPDFDRGVQLLADGELHPLFAPADFAIVKTQSAQTLVGQMTAPDHLADVALNKALYPPGDPAQRFATPATVNALTLDDVQAWYKSSYRPDLTTIVVVGNVDPALAKATVEKYFGAWTATGPAPNVDPPAVGNNPASQAMVPATGRVQSSVQMMQTIGLLRADQDWPAMQVANTVLSGGFYSSLLYHDLREVHGYVYNVGTRVRAGKTRSTFGVTFGSDPQNVIPAQKLIVSDLRLMQTTPMSADRLLRAKAQLMGEVPLRQASYDGVASTFLNYAEFGLPTNQSVVDAQRELGVSAAEMSAAAAKWIRPQDFVVVVTGPASH